MIGTEDASRTVCRIVDHMVVFMCDSNKADCHQRIKKYDYNSPVGEMNVASIALQEPLPLSRIVSLETQQKKYITSEVTLTNFLVPKINCRRYN